MKVVICIQESEFLFLVELGRIDGTSYSMAVSTLESQHLIQIKVL